MRVGGSGWKLKIGTERLPDKKKKPYCFKLKDNEVMFFCVIFDQNEFSILTTEADSEYKSIHHRQPLIINPSGRGGDKMTSGGRTAKR